MLFCKLCMELNVGGVVVFCNELYFGVLLVFCSGYVVFNSIGLLVVVVVVVFLFNSEWCVVVV